MVYAMIFQGIGKFCQAGRRFARLYNWRIHKKHTASLHMWLIFAMELCFLIIYHRPFDLYTFND